ncbi:uncharacterized protein M6B38_161240 [Iris pallida]|uniref:Transcription repressor n=1 Tax=Iris pallida TaxID=29817 RepID=A0AAX6EZM1_IRIPA|nr:uncharacterized protein M6B38_161240 [Iris pallida]
MSSSSKRSSTGSGGGSSGSSIFSLGCGCKDSKSTSVSDSVSDSFDKSPAVSSRPPPPTREMSIEFPSPFKNRFEQDPDEPQSFSGLLRQLDDLEKTVLSLPQPTTATRNNNRASSFAVVEAEGGEDKRRRSRRTKSEGGGRALEESVAVVKETEDPLGDFRRSMLQMIVEKEIVDREELSQLLERFLSLNSPAHHDVILRAFADIWNEVFSGLDDAAAAPDRRSPAIPRRRR